MFYTMCVYKFKKLYHSHFSNESFNVYKNCKLRFIIEIKEFIFQRFVFKNKID